MTFLQFDFIGTKIEHGNHYAEWQFVSGGQMACQITLKLLAEIPFSIQNIISHIYSEGQGSGEESVRSEIRRVLKLDEAAS